MASAAEQMAANLSWGMLGKATDLRQRIFFTIGLLIVYRLGTYIPVPGIDGTALRDFMADATQTVGGMLNMFTGGALSRMGIFALGIMPYISASIIVQLLGTMYGPWQQLKKEGEQGRKKLNQYTRYGTVALAILQGYGIAMSIQGGGLAQSPGLFFVASCVITLVGGTMFLMWLGEQITARGIGNGISLIIFVGIVAEIPAAIAQFFAQGRSGALSTPVILGVIVMVVVVIAFVVFMERALRKISILYPRRQVGMKVYEGGSSHLPIKVNPAGVIPAIFASSILLLPTTISTFSGSTTNPVLSWLAANLGYGQPLHMVFLSGMVVFFAYFYTLNVSFKVDEVAENLKNQNASVPGIRPGRKTEEYLEYVVNRVLVLGSAYLVAVVLLPEFLISKVGIPFYFGGTSVLIVVSVTMDTIQQVQSHLLAHQYEALIEKSQLRGRKKPGAKAAPKAPARR